jgi:hypothetical protein
MTDITAAARLLAVEILLADPESLGNDALEADLYILRGQLQAVAKRGSRTAGTALSCAGRHPLPRRPDRATVTAPGLNGHFGQVTEHVLSQRKVIVASSTNLP